MTDEEKKLHLVTDRRVATDDVEPETAEQRAEREARERHPSGYKLNPPPEEVAEQLDDRAEVPHATGRPVHTAFLVIVEQDGTVRVDPNLPQDLQLEREAHFYDFLGACHNVITDVEASKIAQVSLQHQLAVAEQIQKHNVDAQLGMEVQRKLEQQRGR